MIPDTSSCPRCALGQVALLKSMLAHTSLLWFQCDHCGHLFTLPPSAMQIDATPKADARAARAGNG
jgi:rubredoxin